jgi:hypothetical protein
VSDDLSGRQTGAVAFGEGELAGHQVDQSRFHHHLAAGTNHRSREQELGADGPPALVEDLRARIILDEAIELAVDDGDRRRRGEVPVEGFLEGERRVGRRAREDQERRRRDGYLTQARLGDLEIDLVAVLGGRHGGGREGGEQNRSELEMSGHGHSEKLR